MGKAVVTGYYRYTDISFEWHLALTNVSDRSALKAFISPDSLTSPENPLNLHKGSKEPGITLTMGTMESGESRLLFSSAQIEYIRYWLHTVGFTENLLPLPSSHYLLTESSLKTTSPVTYKSGAELKAAIKEIQKNNKRLKGTDKTLLALRETFEKTRMCWAAKHGTWLAVDFEAWEMEHTVITEYGWSVLAWRDGTQTVEDGHHIVEEHRKYSNNTYVTNNRDHFLFGESQTIKLPALRTFVREQFLGYASKGPLYLVFHDYHQDMEYLKALGAPVHAAVHALPDATPATGTFIVDTAALFAALEGVSHDRRPLDRLCALLQVPGTDRFHNAGNDAHFTMCALQAMADGPPLDLQRNARWPGQTEVTPTGARGVRVEWAQYQIDSDCDDMEGIFGPAHPPAADAAADESDGWVP